MTVTERGAAEAAQLIANALSIAELPYAIGGALALAGWSGWFLSAESITVFKLLFFRGKDVVDLERLNAVCPDLDRDYVRRWIVEMMGEDDERTRKWDEIVLRFAPARDSNPGEP